MKKIFTSLFFVLGIALAFPVGVWATTYQTWSVVDAGRFFNFVATSADGTKLVAAAGSGNVHTSTDSGATWTGRPASGSRSWSSVASSADGTKLVATVDGGQIYTSIDSGLSWTARESARNWRSVASSADGVTLVAGLWDGQMYVSIDSGVTWTVRGPSGTRWWTSIASSADGTKLVAVGNGQVYVSSNSGVNWTAHGPSTGRWVASSADGTKLVLAAANGYIYTSVDSGLSWVSQTGSGSRSWNSVTSSSDGSILAATADGGRIYTSADSGVTWAASGWDAYWYAIVSSADGTKFFVENNSSDGQGGYSSMTAAGSACDISWTARDSNRSWLAIASSADGTKLAAVAVNDYIYTSTDSGVTWTQRGSYGGWYAIGSSADGTRLVAVGTGGAFVSTDSGITWSAKGPAISWLDIASSADGMKLVGIGNTGVNKTIYTSSDGGESWTARDSSRIWRYVTSSSDGTKLVASVIDGSSPGVGGTIYTSNDSGVTWTARTLSSTGSYASMASSADGTRLAVVVFAPNDGGGKLYTSTDSGVTWTARNSVPTWGPITSAADGLKLVSRRADGLSYVSTDGGVTWLPGGFSSAWNLIVSSADGFKVVSALTGGQIYTAQSGCGGDGTSHNMRGYAWSSTAGWLSFSCNNDNSCGTVDYGVDYDSSTNDISGYAWSSTVGWVQFGGLSVLPSGSGTSPFNAKMSGSNMMGWARALSAEDAGWDGWISLKGTGYGVTQAGTALSGFAWGSSVMGWISFVGVTIDDSGVTFDAKVNDTSVDGSTDIAGGSAVSLVATIASMSSGATCSISKTSSGGTALSPSLSASSTATWTVVTDPLVGPADYAYSLTCDDNAGYSETRIVAFSVLLQEPEFSVGGPEEIGVRFIREGLADSQTKTITVYPTNFTGNVNIAFAGISPAMHASTTILYSLGGGAFSANPPSVNVSSSGATTFKIRLSQPIQDICDAPASDNPAGCVDYYITLNATDASGQGAPAKTKVYRINQAPVDAKFKEI